MLKKIRYILEAVVVWLMLRVFWCLGSRGASGLGAFLAKLIGKKHYSHKLADRNMKSALPELTEGERARELDGMWDNLGRIVGEYAHISRKKPRKLVQDHVILSQSTVENINYLMSREKKGGIIFSAHYGNWEIGPKALIDQGFDVGVVYRPLNNPYVEAMTVKMRGVKMIAKGVQGSREIISAIKKGQYVIILADQKVSEGEFVKFFHDDALTSTSLARIALKYGIDLIPARMIRQNSGFKIEVVLERPLEFEIEGDANKDVHNVTRLINKKLEDWIREFPSQWFWVHDRWKK